MIDFKNYKVLVCAGSGGVGKTTVSAALGIAAARSGLRVLVLTIDPAKRLANALGLDSGDVTEGMQVPNQNFKGTLFAGMVDPKLVFDKFIRDSAPNKDVADKLLKNTLYQQLSTTLSGSQEFTSLELLLSAHQSGKYDLIILDTPPAQHAIDFLRSPKKIYSLFQRSVTKWFVKSKESVGILKSIFNKGTELALEALEKITGEGFIKELSGFFENMSELQKIVSQRSLEVQNLLSEGSTGFILVTANDEAKLKEAEQFHKDLRETGAKMSYLVINRTFPEWAQKVPTENLREPLLNTAKKVNQFYSQLEQYYSKKDVAIKSLSKSLGESVPVYSIPEIEKDLVGLEGLEALADLLSPYEGDSHGKAQ